MGCLIYCKTPLDHLQRLPIITATNLARFHSLLDVVAAMADVAEACIVERAEPIFKKSGFVGDGVRSC
jgi:hypothetical protein